MKIERSLAIELSAVTAAILVITHLLFLARANAFIGSHISYFVAYMLIGIPLIVLWIRKRPLDFFAFGLKDIARAVGVFVISALIIFPPFLVAAHFWQKIVLGKTAFSVAGFSGFTDLLLVQLLIVALPEEFYFRGYFQSAMNRIFPGRKRILGVNLGWGFLITAFVFAIAHSIVVYQWWHIFIFFPALVFGYLRERTGLILAPTLFHAAANLLMNWFTRCYV
ncbi:MAG: CPBP family intramembrane glutamic endopeptidase [Pseudomonadota bacterium]